jgi:phosphatidylserine/phosphatidylglycerophosphate/cardiolipin synthase-like enzyme
MKKFKLIYIFLLIFLLTSCNNEYLDFHLQKYLYIEKQNEIVKENKNFNLNNIEERNFEIYITPDKTLIDNIINYINNAKKRVYLEVYILTEKRIIKALKEAYNR